jgi:hypothetical protein
LQAVPGRTGFLDENGPQVTVNDSWICRLITPDLPYYALDEHSVTRYVFAFEVVPLTLRLVGIEVDDGTKTMACRLSHCDIQNTEALCWIRVSIDF